MRAERAAVVLLVLLSFAARAADVGVTVAPAHLQLGTHAEARVTIVGPEDLSAVSVTVNHGTIAAVSQVGPGRFVAEYRAPGQTFPRVAIIAVVGTSRGARVHGWTTLPLWGSAEAVLQTAPKANVSVRIGDRTYGPIQADAKGIGTVAVIVPPGVQSGFYGAKVLDLGLPRVSLNHLVLDHADVRADHPQTLVLRFYAVTEDGKPRSGLSLRARTTLGTLTELKAEAAGVYSASLSLPEAPPAEVELSVWAKANPATATTARLRLRGGPATRVVLAASPPQVVAGTGGDVKLAVKVTDARGHPTDPAPALSASLGTMGRAERLSEGAWLAHLWVPKGFGGATALVVRAEVPGAAPAELKIPLQAGPPVRLEVDPERLSLVTDGQQTAQLSARLLDADRNVIAVPLEASVATGELTPVAGEPTHYVYRAERSLSGGGTTELVLSAGGVTTRVPIELLPAPSRLGFAIKVGFLSNLGNANALTAALNLALWLGDHLGLGLEAGYIFVPRDAAVTSGPLVDSRVLLRAHGVPVLGTVSWRGRLASAVPFQATASGGVVVISSTIKLMDQQDVRELSVVPSAQLTANVGYALGGATPFLEAGVRWMGDGGGNNLTGSLFSVGVSAGCRFDLL